jgi:hypothetical protein
MPRIRRRSHSARSIASAWNADRLRIRAALEQHARRGDSHEQRQVAIESIYQSLFLVIGTVR